MKFVFLLLLLSVLPAAAVETVRVDSGGGAPRILVDGKPVRARVFFGNPGSHPLVVDSTGETFTFDFIADGDAPGNGTLHLRFGDSPGEIDLDDIHVTDVDTGQDIIPLQDFGSETEDAFRRDWVSWPVGPANTVAQYHLAPGAGSKGGTGLQVILTAPPGGKWPGFHIFHQANLTIVRGHHYHVSFWARALPGRKLDVSFYRPGTPYTFLGGPQVFQPQIRMAADAGAPFVSFSADVPWNQPGTAPDWTAADAACQRVLDANPNALLIPRVGLWPPDWWIQSHPDDVMIWDRPLDPHAYKVTADVASPVFRQEAASQLSALIHHLEDKFGPHMAGYHPVGQNTAEWFYEGTWSDSLNGYGKSTLVAWRAWLQDRYATDAALQAAWHDPSVTLAAAAVPTPDQRRAAPGGWLRDPATEQNVIDFTEFQQQMMTDCVCALAHAAREASAGRKLVLFFYGYVFEFGAVHNGPGTSGHYAPRRLLDCPDIDILCSPFSYHDRGLHGSAPIMTAAESISLAGKMYLAEDDTFTPLAIGTPPGSKDGLQTIEQTQQVMLRNTSQCSLRNFATWWMDLGATGWFLDERLWEEMARLCVLDQAMLDHPRPYQPEIAVVVDPASMMRVSYGGSGMTDPGIADVRDALGRIGAPYGQYLLDDVLAGKVHARMYVFLAAWRLSPAQRQQLLAAVKGSGCVWCYAPGYLEGDHTSLDAMRELTGFQLNPVTEPQAWAEPSPAGSDLGLPAFGTRAPLTPLFAATDVHASETWATYPDGSAAAAFHDDPDGPSLFIGPPGPPAEMLRVMAQKSGVHLYAPVNETVYANGPFLVVHALQDGPLALDTGRDAPVTDLLTGENLGPGPQISLPIQGGQTRVLQIDDPNR